MPTVVIPGVAEEVVFPDSMSEEEMSAAAEQLIRHNNLAQEQAAARRTGAVAEAASTLLGGLDTILRPFASTPENPLGAFGTVGAQAGAALNRAGDVAVGALRDFQQGGVAPRTFPSTAAALSGTALGPGPSDPVGAGLEDAARAAPQILGAMALMAAGVPPAIAFGAPPAAASLAESGDPVAAARAGLVGAALPGGANLGREVAGKAIATAVERGLMSGGRNVTQKIAEELASQAGMQALMEGMDVPEYLALPPAQRREALTRHLVAGSALLLTSVPGILRPGPSETQHQLGPKRLAQATAGEVLHGLVNDPAALRTLTEAADAYALEATRPEYGERVQTSALGNVEPGPVVQADYFRGTEIPMGASRAAGRGRRTPAYANG